MDDTTPKVETAPVAPSNEPSKQVIPPVVNDMSGEVEQLRKEKAAAEIRAQQLANQLKAQAEEKEKAEAKKLEEQNQYKELYEQEKAKKEALEQEQTEKERKAELDKVKQETLGQFSEEVKKLAESLDIALTDTDEASVTTFREKLEKISATAPSKVTPNNPNIRVEKVELSDDELRTNLENDKTGEYFHSLIMDKFPGIASMTKQK